VAKRRRDLVPDIDSHAIPGFREPVSCLTHLVGAAVFVVLSVVLIRRGRGDRSRIASLAVFAVSSTFLLSMSGVYHMLAPGTARNVMQRLDHAGVFLLIAGTFTPVHVILFQGPNRWGPLVLIWSAATAGIALRTVFFNSIPRGWGTACFLALGWFGALAGIILWRRHGFAFVRPLLLGGVVYSMAVIFLGLEWPTPIPGVVGPHELWHVAVLAGLGWHWSFVWRFASGEVPNGSGPTA
jgi:channel protein (hemolysin III family)